MSTQDIINTIEKKYGKGALIRYGDVPKRQVEAISTTVPSLDNAIGIGGLPKGAIVEIYGPESSGKTTLTLHIMAEAQRKGGQVAFIDAEHALDPNYALALGVDMDNILLSQPDSGEQGLEILEAIVRSGEVDVVVVDSVAALVPQAELNGEMGDSLPGLHARLMSQALRKLTAITSKTNTLVIFINQLRQKIGVTWGSSDTTTGGKALAFYSSVRLDIRRIGSVKGTGDKVIGNKTKIKVAKNKVGKPYQEVEVDIIFGEGISVEGDLLEVALEKNIFEKKGAWFFYDGASIAQGKEKLRTMLKNPDFFEEIQSKVIDIEAQVL